MAREVGAVIVGVVVGYFTGNPQLGVAAAGLVYGATAPNAKAQGPRLSDLKAPQANFGTAIPYLEGQPRSAGIFAWYSDKREIANESSSDGKGGPGVDTTLFTYEMDALVLLSCNRQAAITRIWSNGKLIWNKSDTADIETLVSSGVTNYWREIRFYSGDADQMPDPTYEAAVGVGNAPAYRGRASVFIEGLNLGQSGQMPVLTFETASEGESSFSRIGVNEDIGVTFNSSLDPGVGHPAIIGIDDALRIVSMEDSAVYVFGFDGNFQAIEVGSFGQFPGPAGGAHHTSYPVGLLSGAAIRVQELNQAIGGTWPILPVGTINYSDGLDPITATADLTDPLPAGEFVGGVSLSPNGHAIIYTAPTTAVTGTDIVDKWYIVELEDDGDGTYTVTLVDQGTIAAPGSIYTFGFGSAATYHNGASVLSEGMDEVWVAYGAGGRDLTIYEFVSGALTVRDYFTGAGGILGPAFSSPSIYLAGDVGIVVTGDTITFWGRTFAAALPTLDQVVSRLCLRTGLLTAGDIDVIDLEDDTVRALPVTQVSPTRSTIESLMAGFLFGAVEGEKIKFVKRGGPSVATIPYVDMGASAGDPVEPLPLRRLNDIELPAQVTVKYANTLNDFQDGAESGDRLVTQSTAVQVVELPIGFTPTEAKRIADANTMDLAVSLIGIGPVSVGRKYAHLEPTDVVTLIGKDGSAFRARIQKATAAGGVNTFELVLDDASVISSVASTDSNYASSTLVRSISSTDLNLLDIPILRDADDSPGKYAAFGARTPWSGAALYDSDDNVTFSKVLDTAERTTTGLATTTLGDFTGGNVFDEVNSLTVTVNGALSSTTNTGLLTSQVNALLVGSEIIQYRDATLISANTYTLTGLRRGLLGTEWAMPDHVASERVVVLQATGLRRVLDQQADIGIERFYKAVSVGKSVSGASSEAFTNTGISQKPYAPVDLQKSASSGAVTVSWHRRSRLASRFLATTVVPLGETTESYDVELRDASDVLVSTETVTSPSWSGTSSSATGGLVAPAWGIKTIGGELVAIRDDQLGPYSTPKSLIRFDPTDGSQIAASGVLGQEIYQWANDGDELYVATADFNNTTPTTYNNSKVKRLTRTALGSVAATYTAGVPGDIAGVACDGTSVWITERTSGNLRKLNETTLASVATYSVNAGITALYHDSGSLWIVSNETSEVIEWDIATTTELQRFSVVSAPFDLLIVGSQVFVQGAYEVGLYDMGTGALVSSVTLSAPNNLPQRTLSEFGSYVAVADLSDVKLLDSTTGIEERSIDPGTSYFFNVAGTDGTLLYLTTGGPGLSASTDGYELSAPALSGYSLTVYQNGALGRGYPATLEL